MKIVIAGVKSDNKRWRYHLSYRSLLLWLYPIFVGFYRSPVRR